MHRFINDRKLEHFLAVYKCGSIAEAAQACGLTQPAISKSISRLEADLGLTLFHRGARGVAPLQTADELFRLASQLESKTRQSLLRMRDISQRAHGSLKVGAGEMWSLVRLPSMIDRFMRDHPNISIDLSTKPMEQLVPDLESQHIDLAVGDMGDIVVPLNCAAVPLRSSNLRPFVRRGHPIFDRVQPGLRHLVRFPWIGFLDSRIFRARMSSRCAQAGLKPPEHPVWVTSLPAAMVIAGKGDYVAVLPLDFRELAARFDLVPLEAVDSGLWPLRVSAVLPKELQSVGPVARLLELMQEA